MNRQAAEVSVLTLRLASSLTTSCHVFPARRQARMSWACGRRMLLNGRGCTDGFLRFWLDLDGFGMIGQAILPPGSNFRQSPAAAARFAVGYCHQSLPVTRSVRDKMF